MKPVFRLIAIAAFAAPAAALSAPAPQVAPESVPGPRYMMTHIEVSPEATAMTLAAIKEYRQASLKEPGAVGVDIFQETTHPSRFIISEVWRDHAAFVARANSPACAEIRPVPCAHFVVWYHFRNHVWGAFFRARLRVLSSGQHACSRASAHLMASSVRRSKRIRIWRSDHSSPLCCP